jgi:hypothetical protein
MTGTAKHETLETDPSSAVVETLERIDLKALSFIQLKRLHSVLQQASAEVDMEFRRRAEEDSAGDTVRVQTTDL